MSLSPNKAGLSLSGGGYRATAFHLGTLKKLNDMNVLSKINVLSTISGGSITGAYYCTHDGSFDEFYKALYTGLQKKDVVKGILLSYIGFRFLITLLLLLGSFYFLFTSYAWLFPICIVVIVIILMKFQFILFPISKRIEALYDKFFYQKKTLHQLLDNKPKLVVGSTNIQTARPFIFSKGWMQDSTYQYMKPSIQFNATDFPVARAVMASSCVPFAFTPVLINKKFFIDPEAAEIVHPILVDGGVYDNQGIHRIMQGNNNIVITSDAGGGSTGEMSFKNTLSLLAETVNVFMARIKKGEMVQDVYKNVADGANKEIAYFSLAWDVENCISGFVTNLQKGQVTQAVIDAHQFDPVWLADPKKYESDIIAYLEKKLDYDSIIKPTTEEKKIARTVGTNLTALSKLKVDCLIKQAEALTEIQVKLYCPSLILS